MKNFEYQKFINPFCAELLLKKYNASTLEKKPSRWACQSSDYQI